jgi:hypothetical protein
MKVCLAAHQSNGYIGIALWKSLECVGVDVIGGCAGSDQASKVMKFPDRMPSLTLDDLKHMIKDERPQILHFYCASRGPIGDLLKAARTVQAKIVHQTGTHTYRMRPIAYPGDTLLVETEDLLVHPQAQLFWPPPAWDHLPDPVFDHGDRTLQIAHLPRGSQKGTDIISNAFKILQNRGLTFTADIKPPSKVIPWPAFMRRMRNADIYVNCMSPTLQGKPHTGTGVSPREAAALGKIVVTHAHLDRYARFYPQRMPYISALTQDMLIHELERLILLPVEKRAKLARHLHGIMVENHSYQATGKRLLEIYRRALST